MIRKVRGSSQAHESSVVSVAWHPNSLMLATGSTDRRVRLFNAYVHGYEPDAPAGALPPNSTFGDCVIEVAHEGCGWVHAVAWSPGDDALLYTSHDGAVAYVRGPQAQVAVRLDGGGQLPLKCLAVVSERLAVGAGWDGGLLVLARRNTQDTWRQVAVLGGPSGPGASGGAALGAAAAGGSGGVVRQLAQMHVGGGGSAVAPPSPGPAPSGAAGAQPATTGHSACVMGLHVRRAAASAASRGQWAAQSPRWHVASAGLDGQVLLWDLSTYIGAT
ncbi:ARPC1 protein [Gonium pectorale]|uniref:Arp2/3 complex 41 kDa subunit n=1 Tax=Gonium pectorale TaxID=33097 RepID=A0A150GYX5_GONPE|nr:ARPC1 protein [Gonium pectorale]|eukprot:KXZ55049.1 ARPC1 protein [Gonium pectorale]